MSRTKIAKATETKSDRVKRLLSRKSGADLAALQDATGWQSHSVRAALSTLRKAGYTIEKTEPKVEGGAVVYRLTASPDGL